MSPLTATLLAVACGGAPPRPAPAADSDGDGIPDSMEREEGTDPDDPSSASAWHPELTERPRLLLSPEDLPLLVERLESRDEPWATLRSRLDSGCERDAAPAREADLSDAALDAETALCCAVLAAAAAPGAAERAAELLEGLHSSGEPELELAYKQDLHAGEALAQGMRAWDLLQGVGYPSGHEPGAALDRLEQLGDFLWTTWHEDAPWWLALSQNNHNTRYASALGLLGMGANMDPRAAMYVSYAASELPRLHDILLAADGGYAEGPAYLVYGAALELPWMIAFDGWLGDGTTTARRDCTNALDPDCQEGNVEVGSPLRDPRVCGAFDRLVETMMPQGVAPDTDDANLVEAPLGLTAGLCRSPVQAYGWGRQASEYYGYGTAGLTPDTLLRWDPELLAEAPPSGPIARTDAGWVVLRGSWDADAPWAMLLAESGTARTGGGAHEHPDALSLLWSARGSYLLIDSGYGHSEVSEPVQLPSAHATILVDGEGPPYLRGARTNGADATIRDAGSDGGIQWARASVDYAGVHRERTLLMAGEDVLVVHDTLDAADSLDHELEWLLHGATDTLAIDGYVASWQVDGLVLEVALLSSLPSSLEARHASHGFSWELDTHGVLAAVSEGPRGTWLAVARVRGPGEEGLRSDGRRVSWPGGSASLAEGLLLGDLAVDPADPSR